MKNISAPKTIILIPAYQPGEALVRTVRQLASSNLAVVVVDDGSGSEYQSIFNKLPKKVHVLHHVINQGKGAALKTGYRYIKANFRSGVVITADADGQHKVSDIKIMRQTYADYPGALLLGVRAFEQDNVPLKSRLGNVITRKVMFLVTRRKLTDTQTGLRAFDYKLLDFMLDVPGERFEYETNVLLECSRQNIEITEQPILTVYENNNQSSHFNPFKDSWAIYKEIFKFASSSLVAFMLDFVMFIILQAMTGSWPVALSVTFANITARIVSASANYVMNKRLVFKHKGRFLKDAFGYAVLAVSIMIVNTILLNALVGIVHITPYIAKIITELSLFGLSYMVQKKVIFPKKEVRQHV